MITWIFNNMIAVGEFIVIIIGGAFFIAGEFGSKLSGRRVESDKLADGLIKRLQQTVDQQAQDIKVLQGQSVEQQREIHQLQGQNDAYLKVITLRNPDAVEMFKEAPAIYEIIRNTNKNVEDQAQALTNLTRAIETFINNLPPMTPTMTR